MTAMTKLGLAIMSEAAGTWMRGQAFNTLRISDVVQPA
jgi:hypothetical protein